MIKITFTLICLLFSKYILSQKLYSENEFLFGFNLSKEIEHNTNIYPGFDIGLYKVIQSRKNQNRFFVSGIIVNYFGIKSVGVKEPGLDEAKKVNGLLVFSIPICWRYNLGHQKQHNIQFGATLNFSPFDGPIALGPRLSSGFRLAGNEGKELFISPEFGVNFLPLQEVLVTKYAYGSLRMIYQFSKE